MLKSLIQLALKLLPIKVKKKDGRNAAETCCREPLICST